MKKEESTRLVELARNLLQDVLAATEASDRRARQVGADKRNRHRLHVLMDAAARAEGKTGSGLDKALTLELVSTLSLIRKYREATLWPDLQRWMAAEYEHTVSVLRIAAVLRLQGYEPRIMASENDITPDIEFNAIGGLQQTVLVELYQPQLLRWPSVTIAERQAGFIAQRAVSKAKRQIGKYDVGLSAVAGFNQSNEVINGLRIAARDELARERSLPNFGGFIIFSIGSEEVSPPTFSQSSLPVIVRYVLNERYFGPVDLRGPTSLNQLRTTRLLRALRQPLSQCPTIHAQSSKVPPFFVGGGPIDFRCSGCQHTMAAGVWEFSINKVVVECPTCGTYGYFESISPPLVRKMILTPGNFYFSSPVQIERNIVLTGDMEKLHNG